MGGRFGDPPDEVAEQLAQPPDVEWFLVEQKTVAIADIDTRRLTRLIREKGAMGVHFGWRRASQRRRRSGVKSGRSFTGLAGADLAQVTGINAIGPRHRGTWRQLRRPSVLNTMWWRMTLG